jgi:hypothetical protein
VHVVHCAPFLPHEPAVVPAMHTLPAQQPAQLAAEHEGPASKLGTH